MHNLKEMRVYAKKAIDFAGGPAALARTMKSKGHTITTQAISQWSKVPHNRVLIVESATDDKVSRHQMRPDIFGVKL